MYNAYRPGKISPEEASGLQDTYVQKQQEWLMKLNASPNIIYYQDVATRFPGQSMDTLKALRSEQLKSYEIEAEREVNPTYIYKGNNPSEALTHLLTVTPCYLECGGALVLASYLALRDTVGKEAFNALIQIMHDGVLKIKNGQFLPFYKRTYYTRTFEEIHQAEQPLAFSPEHFKPGSFAHMVGSPYGFSLHPASEANGYNLLWTGPSEFLGFSSSHDPTATQHYYFNLFEHAFQQNLTYKDVAHISELNRLSPKEYAIYSPWTYRHTYQVLMQQSGEEMKTALEKLSSGAVREFDLTDIPIPNTIKHVHAIGAHAFTEINPLMFLLYVNLAKDVLKAERSKSGAAYLSKNRALPLYDQHDVQAPHKTYAEITYFEKHTLNRIQHQQAGGLMIQGKLPLDVDQECEDALERLSNTCRVLTVEPLADETLALYKQKIQQNAGKLDIIVNAMKRTWDKFDVFYMDHIDASPSSAKLLLAKALFQYCKQYNKQLLITGETDFFKIFPYYDQQLSWMRVLNIAPKPTPLSPSKIK